MKNQKGFSLIELLIVVVIVGIIAAIAVPNLLASRRAANEGSAISALRTIHGAEMIYHSTKGKGKFGTLAELTAAGLIDLTIVNSSVVGRSGYEFSLDKTDASAENASKFAVKAEPFAGSSSLTTGTRSFAIGTPGVIYSGAPAAGTFDVTGGEVTGTSTVFNN